MQTGGFDFVCPACGKEYPTLTRTASGTCMACGSAKKVAGARKSLFVQRDKYNRLTKNSLDRHHNKGVDTHPA